MRPFHAQLAIAALLILGLAACGKNNAVTSEDMTLGNPNAKVTVIEYASVACPHCGKWYNEVFPAFKAKYIDTGKIHFVAREFLTGDPSLAAAGFLLARCAGKDKYFDVVGAIYHSQPGVFEEPRATLLRIAQSVGMNEAQFLACTSNDQAILALQKRVEKYAKEDGINSTPTFVINGKTLVGEESLANIDAAIAAAQAGK